MIREASTTRLSSWRTDPGRLIELSYPEFLAWQAQSTSFDNLAALPTTVYGYSYVLTGQGDPVTVESARVTGEFFDALAVPPLLGRTFQAADDREGARPTVVVGSGLTLTGVDFTVIGVLPAGFVFPRGVDVFTALGTWRGLANNRTVFLQVVGRLRPGVSREQAVSEFDGMVARREAQRPAVRRGHGRESEEVALKHVRLDAVIAGLLFMGGIRRREVSALLGRGDRRARGQATRAAAMSTSGRRAKRRGRGAPRSTRGGVFSAGGLGRALELGRDGGGWVRAPSTRRPPRAAGVFSGRGTWPLAERSVDWVR